MKEYKKMPKSKRKIIRSLTSYEGVLITPCGKKFVDEDTSNTKVRLHGKICPQCKTANGKIKRYDDEIIIT